MRIFLFSFLVVFASGGDVLKISPGEEDLIECKAIEMEALVPPGAEDLDPILLCEFEDGEVYSFDVDPSPIFQSDFVLGQTMIVLPEILVDTEKSQLLISKAMDLKMAYTYNPTENGSIRRSLSTVEGTFNVLVIRMVDQYGNAPKQDEAKLYNNIFVDEKSMTKQFNECSNNKLQFIPAEGENVVNGVLTIEASINLAGTNYIDCGNYAIAAAKNLGRHYTMIVCPDEVVFPNGAAAYAKRPGRISYFKSHFASFKFVHFHEVAHNLGGFHSGTLLGGSYDDYTCALGNKGAWDESGTAFCFNGVKTWQFGWYSDYHREIDPSEHPHKGDLYGINTVNDKSIQNGIGDVVIRVSSSNIDEVLYISYLRKTGPNRDVPRYGNSVVLHRLMRQTFSLDSQFITSLHSGQRYERDWDGVGKLVIKVCSIDAGSPGKANVLIYAGGNDGGMRCDSIANTDPIPPSVVNDSPPKSDNTTNPENSPEPDKTCQDSIGKISFTNNAGKNIKKPCSWVAKNAGNRCKIPEIKEGCPVTCGAECQCIQTWGSFKVNSKQRNCDFVGRNKEVRCKKRLFYAHCPKVCTPIFETKAKHCTEY